MTNLARKSFEITSPRLFEPGSLSWRPKQILEKIFHAHPSDVEDTIQRRLVEKNSSDGKLKIK